MTIGIVSKSRKTSCAALLLFLTVAGLYAQEAAIPHLRKQGTATQLIVNGKPFLIRGGELGNSTSSNAEYMKPVWEKLVRLNLNTVLIPVYWELIEPVEGKYDFTLIDSLIRDARKNNLKLVPLWFASWKNSMSSYAPAWVKKDQKRFPRSQDKVGNGMEILSPFSEENMNADAKAFKAFMRHLKEFDGADNTVLMIQVENEIGMIPDSRDRSQIADKLYKDPVPPELMSYLELNKESLVPEFRSMWSGAGYKNNGTWEEIFGKSAATEELFMAWYFARYVERVTAAGKAEYPIPMFVNAALIRPGYLPGQYPSAGPLPHLMDVWRAGAPKIDFLAPDIYFQNFAEWARKYDRPGNPFFIPEAGAFSDIPVKILYAVGQHNAMGISPFSIESLEEPINGKIAAAYDLLAQLEPVILANQGKNAMAGLLSAGEEQKAPQRLILNGYALTVTYEKISGEKSTVVSGETPLSGGLVIAPAPDEFIIAGTGLTVTFEPDSAGDPIAGLLSVDEGKYANGQWMSGRRLNGDQTHQGRHVRLNTGKFEVQRVKLYRYR